MRIMVFSYYAHAKAPIPVANRNSKIVLSKKIRRIGKIYLTCAPNKPQSKEFFLLTALTKYAKNDHESQKPVRLFNRCLYRKPGS